MKNVKKLLVNHSNNKKILKIQVFRARLRLEILN